MRIVMQRCSTGFATNVERNLRWRLIEIVLRLVQLSLDAKQFQSTVGRHGLDMKTSSQCFCLKIGFDNIEIKRTVMQRWNLGCRGGFASSQLAKTNWTFQGIWYEDGDGFNRSCCEDWFQEICGKGPEYRDVPNKRNLGCRRINAILQSKGIQTALGWRTLIDWSGGFYSEEMFETSLGYRLESSTEVKTNSILSGVKIGFENVNVRHVLQKCQLFKMLKLQHTTINFFVSLHPAQLHPQFLEANLQLNRTFVQNKCLPQKPA